MAPLAMRYSRQSSLPLRDAHMRAVKTTYGGAPAAPHAVNGGGEGWAARVAGGKGGGRRAEGAGGGWQDVAHIGCGLKVHPLLHEAGEGGEVALLRRLAKSLLRLRAQPSALSASQEQGGEARACGEAGRGDSSSGIQRVLRLGRCRQVGLRR